MKLNEDDVVLCTVKRIEGTTVFLDIEDNGQGTMIFSEVSPGRIRNIREFVVPNKKIVCKILRIKDGHPELSLRRVTSREREEVLDYHKKEKILTNMLKQTIKEKTLQVLSKIKESYEIPEFLEEARDNPKILRKFVSGKDADELEKVFTSTKHIKEKQVQTTIKITSKSESGLKDIKKTLDIKDAEIHYLGSSKFSIVAIAPDYKLANAKLQEILNKITENSKKLKVLIEFK